MIKGKYVAQVQIDFNIPPEKEKDYVSLDEFKNVVMHGELSNRLKELIDSELGIEGITCSVLQMYADVYSESNGKTVRFPFFERRLSYVSEMQFWRKSCRKQEKSHIGVRHTPSGNGLRSLKSRRAPSETAIWQGYLSTSRREKRSFWSTAENRTPSKSGRRSQVWIRLRFVRE